MKNKKIYFACVDSNGKLTSKKFLVCPYQNDNCIHAKVFNKSAFIRCKLDDCIKER